MPESGGRFDGFLKGRSVSRDRPSLTTWSDSDILNFIVPRDEVTRSHADPYRAPAVTETVQPSAEDQAGTFATRVSLVLAAAGMVLFWGVLLMVRINPWEYKPTALGIGWTVTIASVIHLVGLGVVFAAPPGRRAVGLGANGLGLLLLLGLLILVLR
jgi:hypothetical protein